MLPHSDNFKRGNKFVLMTFKIIFVYLDFAVVEFVKITPSIYILTIKLLITFKQ
jgi:hypothetical protein